MYITCSKYRSYVLILYKSRYLLHDIQGSIMYGCVQTDLLQIHNHILVVVCSWKTDMTFSFNSIQKLYLKMVSSKPFYFHSMQYEILCVLHSQIYCQNVIQFNSKTSFKDGDPVSSQLIFAGAIQTCEQYNNFSYIYTKTTPVHRTNTGKHNLHFLTSV